MYAASGSSVLPPLIESLWLQFGPYMRVVSRFIETEATSEFQKNGTDYQLVEAFEKGDAVAARAAMEADIQLTIDLLIDLLHAEDPPTAAAQSVAPNSASKL
ncbi:hypothetical protein [Variovorax sp. GT1P44]|uniref:hypothetical protein n=1 Tax=Variovorax sp. GT1P44 TaxID=3443742 RepID=UPI003F47FC5E